MQSLPIIQLCDADACEREPSHWPIIPIDKPDEGLAAAVDWWRSQNMKHAHVVLSIPSRHCLSAWIDVQGLPRRDREQTLIYRLEAELPIAAEDIVADFVESQGGALGIALPFQAITPWIAGLEAAGMQIDHLVPHTMLLLSGLPAKLIPLESVNMLLVQHHDLDLIQLARHGPTNWRWLGRDDQALGQHLDVLQAMEAGSNSLQVIVFDDAPLPSCLQGHASIVTRLSTHDVLAKAVQTLDIHDGCCVNLRRGALRAHDPFRRHRRSLHLAVAAMIVLLATLALGLVMRAHQSQVVGRQVESAMSGLYMQATGRSHAPSPAAIRLQLEAERRRLMALSGEGGDMPDQPTALLQWHELTRRLPTGLRYRITDIRIDPDRIHLEGQARTHSDADQIAAALRSQQGFVVDPPRTEQLRGQGVSYSLTGRTLSPATPAMNPSGGKP